MVVVFYAMDGASSHSIDVTTRDDVSLINLNSSLVFNFLLGFCALAVVTVILGAFDEDVLLTVFLTSTSPPSSSESLLLLSLLQLLLLLLLLLTAETDFNGFFTALKLVGRKLFSFFSNDVDDVASSIEVDLEAAIICASTC